MEKRVGITTDLNRRQKEWKEKYSTLYNWKVRARGLTKDKAQAMEDEYIAKGYEGHHGGRNDVGSSWSVYTFEY